MVDKDSQEIMREPAGGAPIGSDRRSPDAGEFSSSVEGAESPAAEAVAEQAAASATPPYIPPPPSKGPGAGRAFVAGAIGGAIVAAGVAGYFTQFPPKAQLSDADLSRIAALESASSRDAGAIAGLDKRIGALQTATAAEASKVDAGSHAAQADSGDIKTLKADIDAAREQIPAITARLDKLEKGAAPPDLSGLTGRLQKLETEAAAPKAPPAGGNPAALAIVAETIRDKLASGAPYTTELSALTGLGVEPAQLAPLKALAGGAPTSSALAASFQAAEPKLFAAVAPKETGSVGDRLLSHVKSLVQIRAVGEIAGEDPQALSSQVLADLQRGDLGGALAAFAKLPEPAREAAAGFAAEAKSKLDAVTAVQAIRDAAVARLADAAKP